MSDPKWWLEFGIIYNLRLNKERGLGPLGQGGKLWEGDQEKLVNRVV